MPTDETKPLPARWQLFIREYAARPWASKAAIAAGYAPKYARRSAWRLLQRPEIADAVAREMQRAAQRVELTADRLLGELAEIAFVDLRAFFDDDGKPRSIESWTPAMGACVKSVKADAEGGFEITLWDKTRAISDGLRYHGLLRDVIDLRNRLAEPEAVPEPRNLTGLSYEQAEKLDALLETFEREKAAETLQ